MDNNFTGVTKDKRMQTIEIDRYIRQPDNPYIARITGQLTYGEVFEMLKSHLAYVDMLPDEYFILSSHLDPNEHIPKDWRSFSFKTSFGDSEGIYIDISLETDKGSQAFAAAKTLKNGTEDFLRMCRIAAECDLMLNGNGVVFELPKDVRDTLMERDAAHVNTPDITSKSLSETEAKLTRAGLVNGESEDVCSKSAALSGEIERHNDLEDEDLAADDGMEL